MRKGREENRKNGKDLTKLSVAVSAQSQQLSEEH
jgi:hypothetical protein